MTYCTHYRNMVAAHCVRVDVSSDYSDNETSYYIHYRKMTAPHCV
jgi:hypothetical protein